MANLSAVSKIESVTDLKELADAADPARPKLEARAAIQGAQKSFQNKKANTRHA